MNKLEKMFKVPTSLLCAIVFFSCSTSHPLFWMFVGALFGFYVLSELIISIIEHYELKKISKNVWVNSFVEECRK